MRIDMAVRRVGTGFIYGTFPVAPIVFIWAHNYGIGGDTLAAGASLFLRVRAIRVPPHAIAAACVTAMVLCTILSAPVMFVSSQMISISFASTTATANVLLSSIERDVAIFSVFGAVRVMARHAC